MENNVFIAKTRAEYPKFPYDDFNHSVYQTLRALFKAWGKDADNPFEEWVESGDVVVIKPNWVMDLNPLGYDTNSLITNSAIIKCVIDWAARALDGVGTIIIGDAPLQGCDFEKLVRISRVGELVELARKKYPGIVFELEDWRLTVMRRSDSALAVKASAVQRQRDDYDDAVSERCVLVDIGKDSFLEDICDYCEKFRVTCYKKSLMLPHHRPGKHEYLVTKRVQQAKLMINLPKMKTHIKAGLTCALKNLIGINGHKEFLPHHIRGPYFRGGDCYCRTHILRSLHDRLYDRVWEHYMQMSALKRKLGYFVLDVLRGIGCLTGSDFISAGSWSGNETVWRTTLDLNHILYFSEYSPGHILTIVDGIIAGQGQGPLKPTPKAAGILAVGENPAYVDAVIAKIMGYNISRIPTVYNAIYNRRSKFGGAFLSDFKIVSLLSGGEPQVTNFDDLPNLNFTKPKYWRRADVISKS